MNNQKSKNLSILLSIFWVIGGAVSSFGIYGTVSSPFFAVIILLFAAYWGISLKFGQQKIITFFETSKAYAHVLEMTNLVLQIKNLKKEISLPKTTFKYRILYIFALSALILSYFVAGDLELVEKLGTILIYSPFIFFSFNGRKTSYIVFFMLLTMDTLATVFSGGAIVNSLMKWLILSIISLNTYIVENMKK